MSARHRRTHRRERFGEDLTADLGADEPSDRLLTDVLAVGRRSARAAGANPDDANDAAQTVAIRIAERWNTPRYRRYRRRGIEGWRGFVVVAARNTVRDQHRSATRRTGRERRYAEVPPVAPDRPGVHRARSHQSSSIEAYLARLALVEEVRRFAEPKRTIALCYFDEGLSIAEVADVVGLQPATVRKHVREIRTLLQDRIRRSDQI